VTESSSNVMLIFQKQGFHLTLR